MEETPNRELYALLHISPDASTEEIRKAYRQWAQVYHPDKYQASHMKEIATENFQRICEAYEILSDENKRQIYDIYGMEGLNSGLELGVKLNKAEEIKEELKRLRLQKELEKLTHVRPTGSILANLSLPHFLDGDSIMRGMAMTSEVQSQMSKHIAIAIGGNLVVTGNSGGGDATAALKHQISSVASIEFLVSAGLRSLIGIQTTRHLSPHSTATAGLAISLKDGSINLSNIWTRQLSQTSNGNVYFSHLNDTLRRRNGMFGGIRGCHHYGSHVLVVYETRTLQKPLHIYIQLLLGTESSIAVGWQKKEEKMSVAGEIKFGTSSFGASAHYTHRFSSKSHGRIAGRVGSNALEFEIGGGRRISNFSKVRMLYTVGIQGIFWKFELHRGGQKFIIPVMLSRYIGPVFAAGAFAIPTSLYFVFQKFVSKPYFLKQEKQKAQKYMEKASGQVQEARLAASKAQQLLENVSNRKKKKQIEDGGLIITTAVYGSVETLKKQENLKELIEDLASQVIDVTIPLNFLVDELGQLKLHEGVKKSGIMGFCDPCPGEPKKLLVRYTLNCQNYQVVIDDYEELSIPQDSHKVSPSSL